MSLGFSFRYKKASNATKKLFVHGTLKIVTKFTTQTRRSQKENQSFFIATILCFPEKENSIAPFLPVDSRNQESADSWFQESTGKNGVVEF
jgi:hypothetical protein